MQRCFLQTLIQHTHKVYLVSSRTSHFQHAWCLKRFPDAPIVGHQMTPVLGPQKRSMHASPPHNETPDKKPLDVPPAQPRVPLQKEPEKAIPVTSTDVTEEPVSGSTNDPGLKPNTGETDPLQDRSLTLLQRFKRTFKQYGKVLIPVHLVTSTIWFGSFYYAAMKGVNVVPFLEFIGLPESIVGILKKSQGGNALTAYALYKIATPARYTVTLGGTSISVKYLRRYGYLSTPPPVKEYIQDKMEETKELFTEKMEETRDIISGKMEETKDRITEKIQETKDSFMKKKE